jgi:hypothetical protein
LVPSVVVDEGPTVARSSALENESLVGGPSFTVREKLVLESAPSPASFAMMVTFLGSSAATLGVL